MMLGRHGGIEQALAGCGALKRWACGGGLSTAVVGGAPCGDGATATGVRSTGTQAGTASLCRHGVARAAGVTGETVFEIDANRIKFGVNALREVGVAATHTFRMQRVALFTDTHIAQLPFFDTVLESLRATGADVVVYDEVLVEPTDRSFESGEYDESLLASGPPSLASLPCHIVDAPSQAHSR